MNHDHSQHNKEATPNPHSGHEGHSMKPISEMTFWQRFKMSMTMSMGMEHGGLAGREMAKPHNYID